MGESQRFLVVEWRKTTGVPFYFTFEARNTIESRRVRQANSNLTTTCQHVAGPQSGSPPHPLLHDSAATTRHYTVRPLQGSSWCHHGSVHHFFLAGCVGISLHFVEMSSDDEEEQGEEGDEAEREEEEERSSGNEASDGGEAAATTVKARRVTGTEPAAKKLKLRRSNRKRGSKPVGLQIGDAVEGKYGPLCVVAGGVRRSRSTLRGYIVAEAGGG